MKGIPKKPWPWRFGDIVEWKSDFPFSEPPIAMVVAPNCRIVLSGPGPMGGVLPMSSREPNDFHGDGWVKIDG